MYLKHYGKSYFRNDNKWRKAITFGSLLDGKVNGDNLIDIINLYISKKLNFHNDEMYVYDRIRVNDMSEIDHLDDLVYHKDLKNVNDIDKNRSNKLLFDLAFNMSTTYYIDYRFHLDGYMRDMMIDLIDNKNAAIRRSIKCGEYVCNPRNTIVEYSEITKLQRSSELYKIFIPDITSKFERTIFNVISKDSANLILMNAWYYS